MAAASVVHSRIQSNLAYGLRKTTDYAVYTELSILIEGKEYIPDVCAYPFQEIDWDHDILRTEELPMLAIEIVSPRQTIQEVVEKIDMYLNAGIPSCWLVVPYPRGIAIQSGNYKKQFSEGDVLDEPLNIKIAINDIFR